MQLTHNTAPPIHILATCASAGLTDYIAAHLAVRTAVAEHGSGSDQHEAALIAVEDAWEAYCSALPTPARRVGVEVARKAIQAMHDAAVWEHMVHGSEVAR